jgi:hypothetical protein
MIVTACMSNGASHGYSQISGSPLAHLQALAAFARYERRLTFFFVVKQDS